MVVRDSLAMIPSFVLHHMILLKGESLIHMMLVIVLVVLRMVTQEQLATFVHASKDYAS